MLQRAPPSPRLRRGGRKLKKAGKIKTDVKVESTKEEVENGKCRHEM
jgi:hypothetical protein